MSDSMKDVARRLKETRLALGYEEQVKYCKEIKVAKNTYNPFEKGSRPLTLNVAKKIHKRFKVPLDWIFFGETDALPGRLYEKLVREAA